MFYKQFYKSSKTIYQNMKGSAAVTTSTFSSTTSTNYINFDTSIKNEELNNLFLENLKDHIKLLLLKNLLQKKALRTLFYGKKIDDIDCYIVIITNSYDKSKGKIGDSLLIELGNKYNFPRGFPIFWIPNKQINTYGFFPKFDNDNRNDISTDNDFKDCTSIKFNYKYSGFLGQVIAFEVNGKQYWSTTAKNSTNNMFSKTIHTLFEKQMTTELLNELCGEKLHICGETLSFQDQVHGYTIKKEGLIITSIGRSSWFTLTTLASEKSVSEKTTSEEDLFKGVELVSFLNIEDMFDFAIRFNLFVDSIFEISSNVIPFMQKLQKIRNFLTLDKFEKLLLESDIKEVKGTISHSDYVGNLLEGLIIKKSNNKVIKYKFPLYTARTMLLRPNLKEKIDIKFVNEISSFIKHWVLDIDNERNVWETWLRQFYKESMTLIDLYEKSEYKHIGKHIYLMDEYSHIFPIENTKPSIISIRDEVIDEISTVNLVLVFGSIGAGKSTVSEAISKLPQLKHFVHIDGDILDLEMHEVHNLSIERSDYTLYKIYEALLRSNNVIFSTGGGVLFAGKKFILLDKLKKLFGEKTIFNFAVLLSSDEYRVVSKDFSTLDTLLEKAFYPKGGGEERLNNIIDERNSRFSESDKIDEDGRKKMLKINNFEISKTIIKNLIESNILIGIGLFNMYDNYINLSNPNTYKYMIQLLVGLKSNILLYDPIFTQRRILVSLPDKTMKHITLEYDKKVTYDIEYDKQFNNKMINGIKRTFINSKLYNFVKEKNLDIKDLNSIRNYFNLLKREYKGKFPDDLAYFKDLELEFNKMIKENTYYYSLIDCKR